MNRDDIIRMAREAGFGPSGAWKEWHTPPFERFAAIVEQHLIASGYRKCAVGQRTTQFCGLLEQAVAAERERIKQANAPEIEKVNAHIKALEAAAIRARGEK